MALFSSCSQDSRKNCACSRLPLEMFSFYSLPAVYNFNRYRLDCNKEVLVFSVVPRFFKSLIKNTVRLYIPLAFV